MNTDETAIGRPALDKVLPWVYLAVLVTHVAFSGDRKWDYFIPSTVSKSLLMPILMVGLYSLQLSHRDIKAVTKMKFRSLTISAFFFAWVGDIALEFEYLEDWLFMVGLSSFLVAHICYTWSFSLRFRSSHDIRYLKQHPWLIFAVAAYGAAVFLIVSGRLGDMFFPVLVYVLVIMMMLLSSMDRGEQVPRKAFVFALGGSVLFSVSDTLIAYSKFVDSFWGAEAAIMLLYGLAQLLIYFGARRMLMDNE